MTNLNFHCENFKTKIEYLQLKKNYIYETTKKSL